MNVSVSIDLSVPPQEKHVAAMRHAAGSLTDDPSSVRVIWLKQICAHFTVPDARQEDVVDRIGRRFWQVENYCDSSIGFSRKPTRRMKQASLGPTRSERRIHARLTRPHHTARECGEGLRLHGRAGAVYSSGILCTFTRSCSALSD